MNINLSEAFMQEAGIRLETLVYADRGAVFVARFVCGHRQIITAEQYVALRLNLDRGLGKPGDTVVAFMLNETRIHRVID